jgi:hypothetical protein
MVDTIGDDKIIRKEKEFEGLVTETPKSRSLKISLVLRVTGFFLIVVAFILVMLVRQGKLGASSMNSVTFIIAGVGFVLYMGSRIFDISGQLRARRKK